MRRCSTSSKALSRLAGDGVSGAKGSTTLRAMRSRWQRASHCPGLRLVSAEPPGVRAPGSALPERVASPEKYRPLEGLLWTVAFHGPRTVLLTEIGGRAAYRVVASHTSRLPPIRAGRRARRSDASNAKRRRSARSPAGPA